MHIHPTIRYASVGGMWHFVVQIPRMNEIFMGYWVEGQVITMMISVIYKSKPRTGNMIIGRVLMILYEMLLRSHFRSTIIIALLVSGRDRIDGRADAF